MPGLFRPARFYLERLVLAALLAAAHPALAQDASEPEPPIDVEWSFEGPFGVYDRGALQRGFQVYRQVCSACHGLSFIAIRNLGEPGGPGFTETEVRGIAAGYRVPTGPNEQGSTVDAAGRPLMREATPADYVPPPFANDEAARFANNGSLPPDLSLIVKAHPGGADYIYSILVGYGETPPPGMTQTPTLSYNPYFLGRQIGMPQPLIAGSIAYSDGTPNSVEQQARDIVIFLAWASEPKMEERKRTGFSVIAVLFLFTGLLYFCYRRVWHGQY